MENELIKRKQLLLEIPQQLIAKLDKFNYSDISKDEKNLISYLQENNSEEVPLEIFDTINHIKQDFETALENYKAIYS
jgi:hypothetical protein